MRIRVACVNWSHPTAPHAMSYVHDPERGALCEAFHATWGEAIQRADRLVPVVTRALKRRQGAN